MLLLMVKGVLDLDRLNFRTDPHKTCSKALYFSDFSPMY